MAISNPVSAISRETVFVAPTDTVLGIQAAVSDSNRTRLLSLKARADERFVILVSSLSMAKSLAQINPTQAALLEKYWPGKVTFILTSLRPNETVALRFPEHDLLLEVMGHLKEPLYSTSCNLSGSPTAPSVQEAKNIFGKRVDVYLEGTPTDTLSSTLVDLTGDSPRVLRQGAVNFKELNTRLKVV